MKRKRSNNIPPRFQRLQKEKQEASKKENYVTQNNEQIQSQHFLDNGPGGGGLSLCTSVGSCLKQ
jgi:hypothetical protein